jgi:spermidine/putrescine-binding protein
MYRSIKRWAVAAALVAVAIAALPVASSARPSASPEIKALQRQVKALRTQVSSLRSQVNELRSTVADASAKADAATNATTSLAQKMGCLVNATAYVVWTNDVYVVSGNQLASGTGMDISTPSDPVSGYVAGINPSCVPSVFPRFPGSAVASYSARTQVKALSHGR